MRSVLRAGNLCVSLVAGAEPVIGVAKNGDIAYPRPMGETGTVYRGGRRERLWFPVRLGSLGAGMYRFSLALVAMRRALG